MSGASCAWTPTSPEFEATFTLRPGVAAEEQTWFKLTSSKPASATYQLPVSIGPAADVPELEWSAITGPDEDLTILFESAKT